MRHNRRYLRAAYLGFAIDAALVVGLAAMIVLRMFSRGGP